MHVNEELWDYALHWHASVLRDWKYSPPNSSVFEPLKCSDERVAAYLSAIRSLPGILKEMELFDATDAVLSHTRLLICNAKRHFFDTPKLQIELRNVDDSIPAFFSMEIVGDDPISRDNRALSTSCGSENFHEVFRVMVRKLVSGDPFGIAND